MNGITADEPNETAKEVLPMPEKDTQEQIVEVIPKTEADSGAQLPEHAILRFARFLLPKIQEDFEKKEKKP